MNNGRKYCCFIPICEKENISDMTLTVHVILHMLYVATKGNWEIEVINLRGDATKC